MCHCRFLVTFVALIVSSAYVQDARFARADIPGEKKSTDSKKATTGMVLIPSGTFVMGTTDPMHQHASPPHGVYVDSFWMDKYEITNAQWTQFAKATGYKTIAECSPIPKYFPGADPDFIRKYPPFSLVFSAPKFLNRNGLRDHLQWWKMSKGASWKHPEGPGSEIKKKMNYPVVHISWMDAAEYCNWRSKQAGLKPAYKKVNTKDEYVLIPNANGFRLPTEAEWEFAARGGLRNKKYTWGDTLNPKDRWMANIWQGKFPTTNTKKDGYLRAAPVGMYPPNGFGLYDMSGNVWEWCHDHYQPSYYAECKKQHPNGIRNPFGPKSGHDPLEPGVPKRVQRGGSFLCHASYCERYLTYARGRGEVSSGANHIGFRCVLPKVVSKKK
ncbi:MAG: formylglycine-generating enzyme family protein [Gemmataceae bacterium]